MLRVERVTQVKDLNPLKDEWNRLVARSLMPEVYVTHEWVSLWCRHFVRDGDLRVLTVWDGARLVGVAPLMQSNKRLKGFPIRQLGFLLNRCNVRSNLVLAPDRMEDCLAAILEYLQAARGEWDVLSLYGMAESSLVPETVTAVLRKGRAVRMPLLPMSTWENAIVRLEGGWDAYLAGKTGHHRKRARKEMQILESMGTLLFESYAKPEQVTAYLDHFLGIEAKSWKVQRGESLSERPDYHEFYRQIARSHAERDEWRAWVLRIDDRPMATIFGLLYEGTLYAEKTTYVAGVEKASPGSAVIRHAIEDSFREGVAKEMDLDQQTHFTSRWQTHSHRYHHVEIFNGGPYSMALYGLKRLLRGWRGLREAATPKAEHSS